MKGKPIMSTWIKISLHLVSEVRKATIDNYRFNVTDWCIGDAEIFEAAAKLIRSEIERSKTPDVK